MNKGVIYLGNNPVTEQDLCALIIKHLAKGNEKVKNYMLNNHLLEVQKVSEKLVSTLGGCFVDVHAFNSYFYETVIDLGYSSSLFGAPYEKEQLVEAGFRR